MININKSYFKNYFSAIKSKLDLIDISELEEIANLIKKNTISHNKVIIAGNGGSASIASHLTIDFINAAKIRAVNFNESSIVTCFSNDYGYENWISKALESYADTGDIVILISSSGRSKNMLVAAKKAKSMDLNVVTLSGFSADNSLRKLGDINLWVDSNVYNVIEMVHHVWLLAIVDYIIELNKKE